MKTILELLSKIYARDEREYGNFAPFAGFARFIVFLFIVTAVAILVPVACSVYKETEIALETFESIKL